MDFEFIREQTPLYVEAAKLTLHMAVIGVLLAIVVGLICSIYRLEETDSGVLELDGVSYEKEKRISAKSGKKLEWFFRVMIFFQI